MSRHGEQSEVLVVGAGPAGAATALFLARCGREVTVVEARRGVKDQACGEGIMPGGVPVLDELDLRAPALARGARPFTGLTYVTPAGRQLAGSFPGAAAGVGGLAMPRSVLDGLFRDALLSEPRVQLVEGMTVRAVQQTEGRVCGVRAVERGTGRETCFGARLTVAADGLGSRFHALEGVSVRRPCRRRIGIRAHMQGLEGLGDHVEVHVVSGGEIYVAPEAGGHALVALLVEESSIPRGMAPAEVLLKAVDAAPVLAERSRRATLLDRPATKGPLGLRVDGTAGPGYLLAGDAGGALDPVTGEGIALALRSARDLARRVRRLGLDDGACRENVQARRRMEQSLARLTQALLMIVRSPWIAEPAVVALRAWPGVFSRLLGVAVGEAVEAS